MTRRREGVGRALRRALGEEVVLPRIEPRKPGISYLMNKRRLLVFQAIFNDPGIHLRELQRTLGIPLQSLRWHVSVLQSAKIVEAVNIRKKSALFSPISARREEIVNRTLSRDDRFGPILRATAVGGGTSVKRLVKETGSYQQLVSARLKTMKMIGLVQSTGRGSRTRYSLVPEAIWIEGEGDQRERKDALLALLDAQGLAPKVRQLSGRQMTVRLDLAVGEMELQFRL